MIDIIADIFLHNENVGFEDDDEGVGNRYSKHTQLVVADTSHSQMLGKFEYTLPAKF